MSAHGKSEARTKGAGHDRAVYALFAFRARAGGHCAKGRTRAGPDQHGHAEWLVTHGDLADGFARETLLAGVGPDRDVVAREAREATGGLDSRPILDLKLIAEVDPKRKILKGLKCLSRSSRRC